VPDSSANSEIYLDIQCCGAEPLARANEPITSVLVEAARKLSNLRSSPCARQLEAIKFAIYIGLTIGCGGAISNQIAQLDLHLIGRVDSPSLRSAVIAEPCTG
jgi:hypothetical protein